MLQNRKIKIITLLILALFVAAVAVGCGGQKAAEQPKPEEPKKEAAQEKITLKMVGTLPIQHHITKASEVFKNAVEKNSNGKIEIQFYPAQQLYNDKDVVNVLPKGGVEMGVVQLDFWTGLVPSASLPYFPT
jgi:TRAP-type C4-dicarboxylate transport system substrate-binding protein